MYVGLACKKDFCVVIRERLRIKVMTESVLSDHEKSFGDKGQKNCVRLTIIDIDVSIKFAFTPVAGIP